MAVHHLGEHSQQPLRVHHEEEIFDLQVWLQVTERSTMLTLGASAESEISVKLSRTSWPQEKGC